MSALEDARADLAAIEHRIAVDVVAGLPPTEAMVQRYKHRKSEVDRLKSWDDVMITQLATVIES